MPRANAGHLVHCKQKLLREGPESSSSGAGLSKRCKELRVSHNSTALHQKCCTTSVLEHVEATLDIEHRHSDSRKGSVSRYFTHNSSSKSKPFMERTQQNPPSCSYLTSACTAGHTCGRTYLQGLDAASADWHSHFLRLYQHSR